MNREFLVALTAGALLLGGCGSNKSNEDVAENEEGPSLATSSEESAIKEEDNKLLELADTSKPMNEAYLQKSKSALRCGMLFNVLRAGSVFNNENFDAVKEFAWPPEALSLAGITLDDARELARKEAQGPAYDMAFLSIAKWYFINANLREENLETFAAKEREERNQDLFQLKVRLSKIATKDDYISTFKAINSAASSEKCDLNENGQFGDAVKSMQ